MSLPSPTPAAARPWLIVPVRSLAEGKSRLAAVLSAGERMQFNMSLLAHLLDVAAVWPGLSRCVVVSPCERTLKAARARGVHALHQAGSGLNEGLALAAQYVRGQQPAAPLLAVSCDLPQLQPDELRRLVGDGRRCRVAVDRAGLGSNALYVPEGLAPAFFFGLGSAQMHRQRLGAEAVDIAGLAFDIDTPQDLLQLQGCPA